MRSLSLVLQASSAKPLSKELLQASHQDVGLACSDKAAEILTASGAEVHGGSLDDLESLKAGASDADGVIHLAFNHNFSYLAGSCRTERSVIEAIGTTLTGSNKPSVVGSGTMVIPPGHTGTEDDGVDFSSPMVAVRGGNEKVALDLASKGVRVSVVRLPPPTMRKETTVLLHK